MRILLDQGVYDLRNKGNLALTQVAVLRIKKMWPQASLEVITSAPQILRLYFPDVLAISPDGQSYSNRLFQQIPLPILRLILEGREAVWHRWPTLGRDLKALFRLKVRHTQPTRRVANSRQLPEERDSHSALNQVKEHDALIATGAQYMSDACRDDALRLLDRFEAANKLGIPTAMVGQGFGPFDDPELRNRVRAVLPRVDLIFIRDRVSAPPLLSSLGVDPARVIFTGDDAIELAYAARTPTLGKAIGVSLRITFYTQVGIKHIEILRLVLEQAVIKYNTQLIGIPISHSIHEQDDRVLHQLLNGKNDVSYPHWRFDTPKKIVKQVGRCRIVVTGAFHTAVFALAQGIPAVGLARSNMYLGKFKSLEDQFGAACQVIALDDQALQLKLGKAIDTAWGSAEQCKPQLLAAAARQIEMGQAAYRRLYELVESKQQKTAAEMVANEYS
jgi:polysaccharide pyruvyl transferase WcaK-like protein